MEVIFKIDIDYHMNDDFKEDFIETRKAILNQLGFEIKEVNDVPSDKKGHHFWFICEGDDISPTRHNGIQLLLGDDHGRVKINQARIDRGMAWNDYTNFIFSEVFWRRPDDYEKKRVEKIIEKSNISEKGKFVVYEYMKNLENICNKFKKILKEGERKILADYFN